MSSNDSAPTSPVRRRVGFSYWSDPLCIWAFVAEAKLDRILAEFGDNLDVSYRVVPVFGSLPWRFREGPWKKSGVEGRVEETRKVAAEHGHPEVSGECWRVAAPESSWPAGMAAKAVTALEAAGEAPEGATRRFLERARRAFFVDQRNIARRDVILEVAEELALPRAGIETRLDDGSALAALWEDSNEREQLKIQGSPTYLFDGGRARLYGGFGYGILHATVEELVSGACPAGSDC